MLQFPFICNLKILILHQHFKSPAKGGAIRSYYLAKALLEKGHQVIVLTGHNGEYTHENLEGLHIHWLNVPYDNSFAFNERGSSFLKFVWQVINNSQLYRDCDLCYTISVPLTTGLAALWIKWKFRIPFLFEVGDLWPDAPVEMGILQNKLLAATLFGLEKKIYKSALSIVALSQPIKDAIVKKTGGKKHVHVIPNMADTEFYIPKRDAVLKSLNLRVDDKFVVSYIGAIGLANGLDYFLECARASQRNGLPVLFIMCGEGAMLDGLVKHSQSLELKNIVFIPFQNREGAGEVMNVSDAIFVSYKPVPILETGSPNKYFDGLAAGKLILINFGGWIKDEIESNACGVCLDPNSPSAFPKKILPFIEDHTLLNKHQQNSRDLALKHYSRKQLSEKFQVVVGDCLRKGDPRSG